MAILWQGSIVWATVCDRDGRNKKARPVVLIGSPEEIAESDVLVGVAASNSAALRNPLPPFSVVLPHHPTGKVRTGLKKPTVAICNWIVQFPKSDIIEVGGVVPARILEDVLSMIPSE